MSICLLGHSTLEWIFTVLVFRLEKKEKLRKEREKEKEKEKKKDEKEIKDLEKELKKEKKRVSNTAKKRTCISFMLMIF